MGRSSPRAPAGPATKGHSVQSIRPSRTSSLGRAGRCTGTASPCAAFDCGRATPDFGGAYSSDRKRVRVLARCGKPKNSTTGSRRGEVAACRSSKDCRTHPRHVRFMRSMAPGTDEKASEALPLKDTERDDCQAPNATGNRDRGRDAAHVPEHRARTDFSVLHSAA